MPGSHPHSDWASGTFDRYGVTPCPEASYDLFEVRPVACFDDEVQFCPLGRHIGEDALMINLNNVGTRPANHAGYFCELARAIRYVYRKAR